MGLKRQQSTAPGPYGGKPIVFPDFPKAPVPTFKGDQAAAAAHADAMGRWHEEHKQMITDHLQTINSRITALENAQTAKK